MKDKVVYRRVSDYPYSERQRIVVASDEAVKMSRIFEQVKSKEDNTALGWGFVAEQALKVTIPGMLYSAYKEAERLFGESSGSEENKANVFLITALEAQDLVFPPGHPRRNVLYIGHPAKSNVYYIMADFHRVTFEHKLSEVSILLMHLGATKILVKHKSGWGEEFASRISIPLGSSGVNGGGDINVNSNTRNEFLYEATLEGRSEPQIPNGMVWFPHESTWQMVSEGRLKFGLKEFSLSVSYEDDFGINANLKASIEAMKFDIGGNFEDHKSTVWSLEGTFA